MLDKVTDSLHCPNMKNDTTAATPKSTRMERRPSLFSILNEARSAARVSGEKIFIVHAPIYADEHEERVHVYGPAAALALMFPYRPDFAEHKILWNIDAVIEGKDTYFADSSDVQELPGSFLLKKADLRAGRRR